MLLQIVSDRLNQLDCVSRGWVLQGFPLTREQAELLDKAGHTPSRLATAYSHRLLPVIHCPAHYRVYFFDVPVEVILERLSLRRIDPVSGTRLVSLADSTVSYFYVSFRYHLLYDPPVSEDIKQRLKVVS